MCMAAPHRSKIRELRLEVGLTRNELATEMECSYQHVANIENGHGGSSEDFLAKLAVFFGKRLRRKIRVTDLVGGADDPKPAPEPKTEPRRAPTPRPDIPRPVPPPRPPGPKRDSDRDQAAVSA